LQQQQHKLLTVVHCSLYASYATS